MTQEEKFKITSNDYADIILKYNGNPASLVQFKDFSLHILNPTYALIYIPKAQITNRMITQFGFSSIPNCYTLNSEQSLEASGVTNLRRTDVLNLRGEGVIIGLIDTGIDYTNPVFRHEDGTTKIISIWDQNIESESQAPKMIYPAFYGTEYNADQINQALQTDNPLAIVPSIDEIGHGTALAGIAAGREQQANNFSGVAPDADLIVVKLKQVKDYLRDFYYIPADVPCYQENDIIWALQYIIDKARSLRKPIAICMALGTSLSAHDNSEPLNTITSIAADFPGVAITIAAGNEGNSKRHFFSNIDPTAAPVQVELNIGEGERGFSFVFWGEPPVIYSLDILTPGGEYIPRLPEVLSQTSEKSFLFESTVISIDYVMVDAATGKQLILLRFRNPVQGLWRFQVYGRGDVKGAFHIWLPPNGFISVNTYFVNSNPYTTVTSPGNSIVPITVTSYNPLQNTLYPNSGRGYSATDIIKPDLAAPGVNLQCPDLRHGFTTITGTGAAAAHTAGIAAMVLEWSIVEGNYPRIDTVGLKKLLVRGAERSANQQYPNEDWGFGMIDIYNSFNLLRTEIISRNI